MLFEPGRGRRLVRRYQRQRAAPGSRLASHLGRGRLIKRQGLGIQHHPIDLGGGTQADEAVAHVLAHSLRGALERIAIAATTARDPDPDFIWGDREMTLGRTKSALPGGAILPV